MDIANEINGANSIGDQLRKLLDGKTVVPTNDQNRLLIGYWSLVGDFHKGILCLFTNKCYGSAFALARPLMESTVRAHIAARGFDKDIKRLMSDDYRTKLGTVGKEIDSFFYKGTSIFETLLINVEEMLHSYTHAGRMQLNSRFNGYIVEANYAEEDILATINGSTTQIFMVSRLVTDHFGYRHGGEEVGRLHQEWTEHDQPLPK